jgi:serine/threonine protein kinase
LKAASGLFRIEPEWSGAFAPETGGEELEMDLFAGDVVAGKYRLDRVLGQGGMGMVWAATHTVTRKSAALKFVRGAGADTEVKKRFLREARAACAVKHPNVVEIHDVLELEDGSPVMVMEHLRGESLADRLDREPKLPLRETARILLPVISAVGTAHAIGIVHRDLKPQNIFLVRGFEGAQSVKVLDFGIAKLTSLDGDAAQTAGITNTGALLGTPCYMSPEQAFGERDIDHRADVWALGIILYECLSGVLPTNANNIGQVLKIVLTGSIRPLAELAPELPPDVTGLVDRMLSQDRARRPPDLREAKRVLEPHADAADAVDFGPPSIVVPDPPSPSEDTARKRRVESDTEVPASAKAPSTPDAPKPASHDVIVKGIATVDPLGATGAVTPESLQGAVARVPARRSSPVIPGIAVAVALVAAGAAWLTLRPGAAPAVAPAVAPSAVEAGVAEPLPLATAPLRPTVTPSAAGEPAASQTPVSSASAPAFRPRTPKPATPTPAPPPPAAAPKSEPARGPIVDKPPF